MKRPATLFSTALLIGALLVLTPSARAAETRVTGGGGGVYPSDTSFNGVPISGLDFGFGLEFSDCCDKLGEFNVILLGIEVAGVSQKIVIEGTVSGGTRAAANIATFSGTCTIDMGDGTPPTPGVPFTATITTNASDEGTIGLVIGDTTLPNANVNAGSMTIE